MISEIDNNMYYAFSFIVIRMMSNIFLRIPHHHATAQWWSYRFLTLGNNQLNIVSVFPRQVSGKIYQYFLYKNVSYLYVMSAYTHVLYVYPIFVLFLAS